jgi:hypothetical protein
MKWEPIKQRFARKAIFASSGCLEWSGYRTRDGYGRCWTGTRMLEAHRVAYELFIGPIPSEFVVMHTCDNPPCVTPSHLVAAPQSENIHDMIRKGRDRKRGVRGEANSTSKLTWSAVRDIRRRYAVGGVRQRDLAAEYGVDQTNISAIIRNKSWKETL